MKKFIIFISSFIFTFLFFSCSDNVSYSQLKMEIPNQIVNSIISKNDVIIKDEQSPTQVNITVEVFGDYNETKEATLNLQDIQEQNFTGISTFLFTNIEVNSQVSVKVSFNFTPENIIPNLAGLSDPILINSGVNSLTVKLSYTKGSLTVIPLLISDVDGLKLQIKNNDDSVYTYVNDQLQSFDEQTTSSISMADLKYIEIILQGSTELATLEYFLNGTKLESNKIMPSKLLLGKNNILVTKKTLTSLDSYFVTINVPLPAFEVDLNNYIDMFEIKFYCDETLLQDGESADITESTSFKLEVDYNQLLINEVLEKLTYQFYFDDKALTTEPTTDVFATMNDLTTIKKEFNETSTLNKKIKVDISYNGSTLTKEREITFKNPNIITL